ncbi:MAG TPA: magnesium chelatase ATPase subunit D [Blastocatellia bacterium]|nr:magnesium chelatase ATPase subunit D [Blastocatellia bacterium]
MVRGEPGTVFPFTAIIGCEAAKRALLLLAVEPGLKGVLIGAGPGSAKSTLTRSFAAILEGNKLPLSLPLSITEENLLGGLDVERTLSAGKRVQKPGLLSTADGGILLIDDLSLLDAKIASLVGAAFETGEVKIEREGYSAAHPAEFLLIGAYNPADGPPCSALYDRVGMIVESPPVCSPDERAAIISRSIQSENDSSSVAREHALAVAELKAALDQARRLLPRVQLTRGQAKKLAQAALALGVEGNRVDIFAVRAARASAALAGRGKVEEDDLIAAIQLVLLPRANTPPVPERDETAAEQATGSSQNESIDDEAETAGKVAPVEDLIIKAIDARVPENLFEQMRARQKRSRAGKRGAPLPADRGRAVTSSAQRGQLSKPALFATLAAAAPFQAARRKSDSAVKIKKSDLRYRRFKNKSGILFIFAVDASGSMAFNRMAEAKGALARTLRQAYLHRDKVALISFRGEKADVLLHPTRSMEIAKSLIDGLPAGGGTPIAAGLTRALELARQARIRKMSQTLIVLMTDGRANVPSQTIGRADRTDRGAISEELKQIGRVLLTEGVASVVIDTRSRFVSSGEARNLAEMLGGKYLYLPRANAAGIHKAIETIASDMRE